MTRIAFTWNEASYADWQDAMIGAGSSALQQDWAYGQAIVNQGHQIHKACLYINGRIRAVAQIAERQIVGPMRIALLMRGPVWIGSHDQHLEEKFLQEIRHRLVGAVLLWTPDRAAQSCKIYGFRRVMTGYSTIMLALTPNLEELRIGLHGKWRNLLRSGERSGLVIEEAYGGRLVDWLIQANEAYRAKVGYAGPTPGFIRSLGQYSRPNGRRVWLAMHEGEAIAGIILHIHGNTATYYAGCTSTHGRKLRAHHLLLWHAVTALKNLRVTALDLGGIDTEKAAGIARFKLGMGGEVVTLAGTYLVPPKFGTRMQKEPQLPTALSQRSANIGKAA